MGTDPRCLDLQHRAARGDREALVELLEQTGPSIRKQLSPKLPKRWQALLTMDDVLQETYTDAFLDIAEFTPADGRSFERWLQAIAHNNLQGAIRMLDAEKRGGGGRKRLVPGDSDDSRWVLCQTLGLTRTTPSRVVARTEACVHLQKAIDQLPEDHRAVVRLYDLERHPVAVVCAALGRSPGAVFMLRARAHRKLRELMGSSSDFLSRTS